MAIQLKRQHSADHADSPSPAPVHRTSPRSNTPTAATTPPQVSNGPPPLLPSSKYDGGSAKTPDDAMIGSPLKKQRASLSGLEEDSLRSQFGLGLAGVHGNVLERIEQDKDSIAQEQVSSGKEAGAEQPQPTAKSEDMEEEL